MKTIRYIAGGLLIMSSFNGMAQDPDQNPNWRNSAEKYAAVSDELTATESETIQETYKAYDWREAKAEDKQNRIDRRYELRKMRIQSRYNYPYSYGYHNGYYQNDWNNGYYKNGYYNNGYYNNGWNNGYYNNGWNNNYFNKPNYNSLLWGAGLGLGLYYLLN